MFQDVARLELQNKVLEITVWDYDRFKANDFLGELIIELRGEYDMRSCSILHGHIKKTSILNPSTYQNRSTAFYCVPAAFILCHSFILSLSTKGNIQRMKIQKYMFSN